MKVWPANQQALRVLRHPQGNVALRDGDSVEWPDDSYTARRIAEGDVVTEEGKKFASPTLAAQADPAPQPSSADDASAASPKKK